MPNNSGNLRTTGALKAPSRRREGKARVLVVDDETPVRHLLVDVLSLDYECDEAADGREAIKLLQAKEFDLIMTDIMMPHATGIDVLRAVTERNLATPVVLVTAVQEARNAIDAIRLGAFDYILKPFEIEEIELCARRAIEHKCLLDDNIFYQTRLEALVVERTADMRASQDRLESSLLELGLAFRLTLGMLSSAVETRNGKAVGHAERVTAYALRLGRELGFSNEQLQSLEAGALLHDIGMMVIPEAILCKPGPLDAEERAVLSTHAEHGANLLRKAGTLANAASIVEQHHERWDGTGYPKRLAGEQIDRAARVFAVADCIEAMTTDRPYRTAAPYDIVAEELRRGANAQFDPEVVDAFFRVPQDEWDQIRLRTLVGEIAISAVTGGALGTKS